MAMRELPFNVNVSLEQEKIEVEELRNSLIGSLQAMTQAIPQMTMQGQDPTDLVRKIAEVIKARQKGKQIEDAIEDIFASQVPPAGSQQSVEQPVPAAPGAPVGGSLQQGELPPGQQQQVPPAQAKPELQTILSSLSGTGSTKSTSRISSQRRVV